MIWECAAHKNIIQINQVCCFWSNAKEVFGKIRLNKQKERTKFGAFYIWSYTILHINQVQSQNLEQNVWLL